MEANEYDTNHLDSDVLLPPRKRLLAGLKRQSSESPSKSSSENLRSTLLSEYDTRLHNLMKSYKNGSHMPPEEIAKAAESAAIAAAKAAEAARAAAEEKAVIAAKAIAAAKNALTLIASSPNETGSRAGHSKKNKLKKHVPVQLLYKEQQAVENCGTDEELARKLHRAINSSPRISKHSPSSKNKHKKLKPSLQYESNGVPNGMVAGNGKLGPPCEADDVPEGTNSEGSYVAKAYEKLSKSSKADQLVEINGEAESSHSKERNFETSDGMHTNGRKRGRIKQKKLPLSLCSFKDRANPKDELNQSSSELTKEMPEKSAAGNISPGEPRANTLVSIEPAPTWKCQDFKVPQCIKPNKAVQS